MRAISRSFSALMPPRAARVATSHSPSAIIGKDRICPIVRPTEGDSA